MFPAFIFHCFSKYNINKYSGSNIELISLSWIEISTKQLNLLSVIDESVKAIFIGLNTVDLQFFIDGFPRSNTKTKAKNNEIAAGGPATNAAIACSFLGAETTLITPIGKHSLSRFITDDILKHKVRLIDPIEDIESKPVFASIITDEINGERTVFSYHPERNEKLLLEELQLEELGNYNIALFDGFYPELSTSLAKQLQKAGVTTLLDGGSWKPGIEELLPFIDIAICSNDFIAPEAKTLYETANTLANYGIHQIAFTRGEKSILSFITNHYKEITVPNVNVKDTLGAGDIFHGAFCYYYAFQPNFEQALQNASSIAAISCKHRGTRSWMKNFTT